MGKKCPKYDSNLADRTIDQIQGVIDSVVQCGPKIDKTTKKYVEGNLKQVIEILQLYDALLETYKSICKSTLYSQTDDHDE